MEHFTTEAGHFWLRFDNGYTLSCFNGYGSHTENWDKLEKWEKIYMVEKSNIYENIWSSDFIEVAILDMNGDMVLDKLLNYDDVVKTVNISELVEIINFLYSYGK